MLSCLHVVPLSFPYAPSNIYLHNIVNMCTISLVNCIQETKIPSSRLFFITTESTKAILDLSCGAAACFHFPLPLPFYLPFPFTMLSNCFITVLISFLISFTSNTSSSIQPA